MRHFYCDFQTLYEMVPIVLSTCSCTELSVVHFGSLLNISWQGNNLCDVFQVNHEGHAYGHRETTSNGRTEGQYQVVLPDGRVQTVKYYADNSGFHPQIIYTQ